MAGCLEWGSCKHSLCGRMWPQMCTVLGNQLLTLGRASAGNSTRAPSPFSTTIIKIFSIREILTKFYTSSEGLKKRLKMLCESKMYYIKCIRVDLTLNKWPLSNSCFISHPWLCCIGLPVVYLQCLLERFVHLCWSNPELI